MSEIINIEIGNFEYTFEVDFIIENDSFTAPYGSNDSCRHEGSDYVYIESIKSFGLTSKNKTESINVDVDKLPEGIKMDIETACESELTKYLPY